MHAILITMKKILLATNNGGKTERYTNLIHAIDSEIEIYTPKDFGLENINPEENGKTLEENAEIKARAYWGKVDMPILANDTGFYVEGEGMVDTPKRAALGNTNEEHLTKEQSAKLVLDFWKEIASKHAGAVDAAWVEEFVLLDPNGTKLTAQSRREVVLTNKEHGAVHLQMPVRALYISKTTGKPAAQHTPDEEITEMKPLIEALSKLIA